MMRSKVLRCFKTLHRTRLDVFEGDQLALTEARKRINAEFQKNKHEKDPEKIKSMLKVAEDVNKLLRKTVVQGVFKGDNRIELKITKDTVLLDSPPLPK
ncbi:Complex III assembly factor LYRM7 [Holothuria leucospilota]|uniref:Complex III assembly factor LYRM7 n=1 Tax=Holothuria leucospilota TaxID=206669 RepID=A0A9Q1C1D5_HOLLE|nr:Complex III assembly factor LYRM7 [Holothuria leucospilota]